MINPPPYTPITISSMNEHNIIELPAKLKTYLLQYNVVALVTLFLFHKSPIIGRLLYSKRNMCFFNSYIVLHVLTVEIVQYVRCAVVTCTVRKAQAKSGDQPAYGYALW